MAFNSIPEYTTSAASNTDIGGVSIAEGFPATNINNSERQLLAQLKTECALGSVVASASTVDISKIHACRISGTTPIVTFTITDGTTRWLTFAAACPITYDGTKMIIQGGVSVTMAAGDMAIVEGIGVNQARVFILRASGVPVRSGLLLNTVYITATGNYTKNADATTVEVELVGGGASGGGVALTVSGQAAGGGGGAGGYARKTLLNSTLSGTTAVTVGLGGAAPTAGANNGNPGNTTTFSTVSATGGGAGVAGTVGTGTGVNGVPIAGGVGSGGDINAAGGTGEAGFIFAGVNAISGKGGASYFGDGGTPPVSSGNGNPGVTPGAGGSGALNGVSQPAHAGGAGANGLVIVREYS